VHHLITWLITTWFQLIGEWGYLGVFVFMAVESSIIPLPSEVIIPPAAYYAAQGKYEMWLVVLAGAAGSLFGSLIMYGVSLAVGRPFLMRYGRYVGIKPDKVELAERFFLRYSTGGIFFSRLIPVVRHLCSIPAGLSRMSLPLFATLTTLGAGLWCGILAWFGSAVIGNEPHLLDSPEILESTLRHKLQWFGLGALVLLAVYIVATRLVRGGQASADAKKGPAQEAA
jgi:membrane protein DedA with SNARE-associated domain